MANTSDQLHLVIIGAGVAGLSAAISTCLEGHQCTVLEKAAEFQEVGAGLQLTPNATRLLRRWGVLNQLAPVAAAPSSLSVRRFDGSKVLAHDTEWQETMIRRYGAPFWDIHRADLQAALVSRAREVGVDIRTGTEVADIDFSNAAVTIARSGERIQGDVVLAADGLWSRSRDLLFQQATPPQPTGDLAYRIVLTLEDVRHDPELTEWVANPTVNFWVGPESHVVGYSVRAGREFNLVLLCPDNLPEGCTRASADLEEMRDRFKKWDPILTRFLNCVKTVDKWRLMHFPSLQTWNDKSGRFIMSGDSCHPMLPYLAQGANSAMEDGAVLGRLLGSVTRASVAEIPRVLQRFQALRKQRVEEIAKQALKQRWDFHLPDGPLQEARDRALAGDLVPDSEYPSRWTCPKVQSWLYGYDAVAQADQAVQELGLPNGYRAQNGNL